MDKDTQIVSLDEMVHIYINKSPYSETYEFIKDLPTIVPSASGMKIPYLMAWRAKGRSLLYLHIVAEQLFRENREAFNWQEMSCFNPHGYVPLVELLMKPLVWIDSQQYLQNMVVDGRIAKEQYMPERLPEVLEFAYFLMQTSILHFANEPYVVEIEEPDEGYLKGMHYWLLLTCDYEGLVRDALDGKHVTYKDIQQVKAYDAACLRRKLGFIADELGGAKAAQLLRTLQKEWKNIKLWKTELHTMTDEDISHFEQMLFHGFDDLLVEWEGGDDAPKEQPKTTKITHNRSISSSVAFEQLLQCEKSEKGRVMKRLHELLDGKGGKDVAIVLAAAMHKYKYLLRIPSETQYSAAFELKGTWRAVRAYIKSHTDSHGVYQESLEHVVI